jgi:Flp pilus assembly protein TadG
MKRKGSISQRGRKVMFNRRIMRFVRPFSRPSPIAHRQSDGSFRERAAAVVEFAVVLPLLLTILFGIIEYGWVFMVRQTLQSAAREGCRVAVLQTSTASSVYQRVGEVMTPTGLSTYTVSYTASTEVSPVERVVVTVPYADVSLMGGFFGPRDFDLGGSCSMRKEGWTGG